MSQSDELRTPEIAQKIYESPNFNLQDGCLECEVSYEHPDTEEWRIEHRNVFIETWIHGVEIHRLINQLCPKCAAYRTRATMPYAEYLQTQEWQEKRLQALARANYKCELCFSEGVLHVHHKTYQHRGNELPHELIVLCAKCHAKFHDKLPEGK